MGSYSDSTSDLDEELPVFDFLQSGPNLSQDSQTHTEELHPDGAGAEEAARFSSAKCNTGARTGLTDVMMISSESDDDVPYGPLAQRLKQRRDNMVSASSTVTNGTDAEQQSSSNLASSQLSNQINLLESERAFSLHPLRTVNPGVSGCSDQLAALDQRWLQPRHVSGSKDVSPAKRKQATRTAEEIQASREEALKRKQARERQQRDKEVLRQEQERQKVERKTLAEAAKALRPEECIKHMVVAVDPGREALYCK